ncbi:heparanase-like protein 2 isoform X1 [Cannabis sativa]|uniref:heparanase-like protein 2 isoform X1 n=1 Tax=Cannabis sativa TaxID=3483 RepID=UPI0029C9EE3A|nr:heparanase-like protein 2 isoform X1 [Cannabis sativa]
MKIVMKVMLFNFVVLFLPISSSEFVRVTIRGESSIGKTDDNFICATLDWWPPEKCDYNQCPWGNAGILNLDIKNKIFVNAITAFNPLRIRLGGSLEDLVVYDVGNAVKECPKFRLQKNGLFGFSNGCLSQTRWDELNYLFNQTRALVTFSLNALYGKIASREDKLWIGEWNPENARQLMEYTLEKGYKIDSYELGNELCGSGVAARVNSVQYGRDIIVLKNLLRELYPIASTRPKVLGPAGFYDEKWFSTFLETTGPGIVDGVTHHIYNLGAGVDPGVINRIQDPVYLDKVAHTYRNVSRIVKKYSPKAGAWVGEAGGAYNSGGKNVQDRFVDGFWYLDQLGMASSLDHKVYCRQALIGGFYGLLNTTTFVPNPDYYGALLWHRLMGKEVLAASHDGSPKLRAYSHCSKNKPGITLLLINFSNSTFFHVVISVYPFQKLSERRSQREEYHLTAKNGYIQSDEVLLNGTPLQLTNSSDIPLMEPILVDSYSPVCVAPDSFVFVVFKDKRAFACV